MKRVAWLGILAACLSGGCPLPELGGEGQDCFEPPDECNGGLLCRNGTCIRPDCTRTEDCGQGEYCDIVAHECRPGCSDNEQCQSGFFCDLTSHECTRDPNAPAQLGEPCHFITDFGTVHADANNCEENMMCIGFTTEGGMGYCPGQTPGECWMVQDVYNPACVNGVCGGSFCCAFCSGGTCSGGYEPLELGTGECVCIPLPESDYCHPLDQNCPSGERCIPTSILDTRCVPIGFVGPDGPCRWADNQVCQSGFMCVGSSDQFFCRQLCDMNDSSTCVPGFFCAPISEIERWGFCKEEA